MTMPLRAMLLPALVLALMLVAGWDWQARADQKDQRLDPLFEALGAAASLPEARALELRIWRIWYRHEDEGVAAMMADGQAALADDDRQGALAAFDRAVRLAPNFAEAWNARATVHYLLGDYRRSLADIRRTLMLEPRHFGALAGRGLCLLRLGQPEQALGAFEASLEVHPFQPGTRWQAEQLRRELSESAI